MVGILSYGAYIPMQRMKRNEIARSAMTLSGVGRRAVASWNEDSLSMAVALSMGSGLANRLKSCLKRKKISVHQRLFCLPHIETITAPWILVGRFDQSRSHWI